jgi:hypothetical protein
MDGIDITVKCLFIQLVNTQDHVTIEFILLFFFLHLAGGCSKLRMGIINVYMCIPVLYYCI